MSSRPMVVDKVRRYTIPLVLAAFLLLSTTLSQFFLSTNNGGEKARFEPPLYEAFMSQAKEVSLDEFIQVMKSHGYEVVLPARLPKNLTLSAIYYKCCPLVAMVLYSAKGEKDYRYSELAIEISPNPFPLSEEYLQQSNNTAVNEYVIKVGNGYARIIPKAPFGDEERNRIFGPQPMAIYWDGGLEYLIGVLPPISLEDLEYVVRGLEKAS
ncbi:MAG: hypothetical protein QXM50_00020 [Candidatus Caldarchaeum sp.]|uniref:DUF4367 domain-containing protein n=1 Tax=Caldiarchaeum subterraneum TaxID=311458 RepID=A0A7J3WCA3_CALS0|nr:hypothetical protein [Candidatus Caldarchaeales archaeon]MDJ0272238.1 hypothetical protein [Candidatus Caldarchaeales archaeon]